MSRSLNKAVIALFEEGMKQFREFTPEKPPKPHAWPGERAYKQTAGSIAVWLSLLMSPKGYNQFTVECGWSRLGRYPQLMARLNAGRFSEPERTRRPGC